MSGSTLEVECNCDPIKLEAFQDEQLTTALPEATYQDPPNRRMLQSTKLITAFAITNYDDKSATPYANISFDLRSPGYQEIWVKVTDKIGHKYTQKMKFSVCGAETFEDLVEPNDTPIEFDQYALGD